MATENCSLICPYINLAIQHQGLADVGMCSSYMPNGAFPHDVEPFPNSHYKWLLLPGSLGRSISKRRGVRFILFHPNFVLKNLIFKANSVDPVQAPHLIWVYTVCQYTVYGFPDTNALE